MVVRSSIFRRTQHYAQPVVHAPGKGFEKMIGAYVQSNINEDADFLVGANYRFKDAIVPYAGRVL